MEEQEEEEERSEGSENEAGPPSLSQGPGAPPLVCELCSVGYVTDDVNCMLCSRVSSKFLRPRTY